MMENPESNEQLALQQSSQPSEKLEFEREVPRRNTFNDNQDLENTKPPPES